MANLMGLPRKIWNLIFMISFSLLTIFCIGTLGTNYWFKQDWQLFNIPFATLKGGLLYPKDDSDNWQTWYNDCESGISVYCGAYRNFYVGGVAYIIFTTFSMILMMAVCFINTLELLGKYQQKKNSARVSVCCVIFALVLYVTGFVIWAVAVRTSLNCTTNLNESTNPKSCIETGGTFAIVVIVLFALVSFVHCCFGCKVENNDSQESELAKGFKG